MTKRLILFDVKTIMEYDMISANRPMELVVFACYPSMLWPPVGCRCSDVSPPLYSDNFAASSYYQTVAAESPDRAINRPAAASDDEDDEEETELPSLSSPSASTAADALIIVSDDE